MDVEQQADDVRLDVDHQKLDYENFIDDDEVALHCRRRDTDVTYIPGSDVRDELDAQREGPPPPRTPPPRTPPREPPPPPRVDWLLRTESLHGARSRRITINGATSVDR